MLRTVSRRVVSAISRHRACKLFWDFCIKLEITCRPFAFSAPVLLATTPVFLATALATGPAELEELEIAPAEVSRAGEGSDARAAGGSGSRLLDRKTASMSVTHPF
jgi:hypothetical protein